MKKQLLLILFCGLLAGSSFAGFKVQLRIIQIPSYTIKTDPLFVAGNFNKWNPGDPASRFTKNRGDQWELMLNLEKGAYEYKITRGDWSKGECSEQGKPIDNRHFSIDSDTIINITVQDWADHFASLPKRSTANRHVQIIDSVFFIPQLNRSRRIWVYLPASYQSSKKKYPVLYMHDGQNLFDDLTGFSGEWGVDEALDSLEKQRKEIIVVGIDHGGSTRINEYSPYDMEKYGKGEGDQYVDFLVKTLKPYIDKHYRTSPKKKNTFIAGSSMGGLISMYAVMKYPKVFGGAGVFSPAFWIVPQLETAVKERASKIKSRIYFYAGLQESESMVPDMLKIFEEMNQHSKSKMTTVIRAGGKHNEATWRKEFPLFYKWMWK